jgi:RNA polymerase sigma factor (sigma-70 family)
MHGSINIAAAVIHTAENAVSHRMSLEISVSHGAWHKGFPPLARLRRPPALRRTQPTGPMEPTPTTPTAPNLSELLVRVGRERDIELFEQLFRHFAPRVKAYMAKTGSPTNAEELMQETMVAVWHKAALYDPAKGAASTWIFSIARNLRIDAYRREKHPEFDENDPALQPSAEMAADNRIEGEQSARLIRAALAELPADQAEVLRLAYYEDNSQSEIATALSLPLGTVKSRMRLAFGKLRAVLGTGDVT